MATGPEHYLKAEEYLAGLKAVEYGTDEAREMLGAAQVHAILALAAAAGLNDAHGGKPDRDHLAWIRVAGVKAVSG